MHGGFSKLSDAFEILYVCGRECGPTEFVHQGGFVVPPIFLV
jgi:hypothetical protein